jgi:hypothetical protein
VLIEHLIKKSLVEVTVSIFEERHLTLLNPPSASWSDYVGQEC